MFKKLSSWLQSLSHLNKILVTFLFYFIYWFITWVLVAKYIFEEDKSWLFNIFYAFVQAFFMTLVFKWREIKRLFKRNKS